MGKKKYTKEQKQRVIARLALGEGPSKIAREEKIPYGTVAYWKRNWKEMIEHDDTLGYHVEEFKKFIKDGWKIIHAGDKKIIQALKTVKLRTPKDIRDMAVIVGIYKDKIDKGTPQPQLEAGAQRPLIDISKIPPSELEIVFARFKQIGESAPQLEEGEVIEGESREIKEEK